MCAFTVEGARDTGGLFGKGNTSLFQPQARGEDVTAEEAFDLAQVGGVPATPSGGEFPPHCPADLQSPAHNVISALQGNAGQKIAGLVKAVAETKA